MAFIGFTGFETGNLTAEGLTANVNAPVIQPVIKHTGQYALQCNNTTSKVCGIYHTGGWYSRIGVYLYIVSLPAADTYIMGGKVPTHEAIKLTTTGKLDLYKNYGLVAAGSVVLSTGQWYRICYASEGQDLKTSIFINGIADAVLAAGGGASGNAIPSVGIEGSTTGNLIFDDFVWDSDTSGNDIGDIRVAISVPNGAGCSTQYTPSTGTNLILVDSTPDNSYPHAGLYLYRNFTIVTDCIITGASVVTKKFVLAGSVIMSIRKVSAGLPTGSDLCSVTVDPTGWTDNDWNAATFTSSLVITAGTYALVLSCATLGIEWDGTGNTSGSGYSSDGSSWTAGGYEFAAIIYGEYGNFSCVNEVPPSDVKYVSHNNHGGGVRDYYTVSNLSNINIVAVKLMAWVGSINQNAMVLIKDDGVEYQPIHPNGTGWFLYLYTSRPGGLAWTTATFNALQVGIISDTVWFGASILYEEYLMVAYATLPPTVTTQAVTSITTTTATGNGNITAAGETTPTIRGICYSSVNNPPTTTDDKVEDSGSFGTGAFTESLTGLTPNTLYYVRAYATNTIGTAYGAVETFTTLHSPPVVNTLSATKITATDYTLCGNITYDDGLVCTGWFEYGLTTAYGDSTAPQALGAAPDAFDDTITLTPGTYHYRAVALNSEGAYGYGVDKNFKMSSGFSACDFGGSFFTPPVWTDITPELMELKIHRGRNHELDRIEAGTATFTMNNISGNWWRYNTNSPYYPNVKPLTMIKFEKIYNGVVYPLFTGYIESIPHKWLDKAGFDPYVDIACVDIFKSLSRFVVKTDPLTFNATASNTFVSVSNPNRYRVGQDILIADSSTPTGEVVTVLSIGLFPPVINLTSGLVNSYTTADGAYVNKYGVPVLSGGRINDILDDFGFPQTMRNIDAGEVTVIAREPGDNGINALEYLLDVAKAESGLFFIAVNGYATFQSKSYRQSLTSGAIFNDNGTDSKYSNPALVDDDTFLYNEADIISLTAPKSFDDIIYYNSVAQGTQGPRIYSDPSSNIYSVDDALDMAYIIVGRYSDTKLRVNELTILPDASPADLYPKVLGFDLSERITLNLNNAHNPAAINQDYNIEAIDHEWSMLSSEPNKWITNWQIWDTNQYRFIRADGTNGHAGELRKQSIISYADCHNAANADNAYNDPATWRVGQYWIATGPAWVIYRGVAEWDTSGLGAGANILSAILLVHDESAAVVDNNFTLQLTPAVSVSYPLGTADYGDLLSETTDYGSLSMSSWNYGGWNTIVLTAAGIAAINKTGTTRFGIRSSRDITPTDPAGMSGTITENVTLTGDTATLMPRLVITLG
jgi:hypothetical protein